MPELLMDLHRRADDRVCARISLAFYRCCTSSSN